MPTNHLAEETSPYLLQHKDNPVDWHPWSKQALALAKQQNRPILLSIGYSACHWCHVMAHESFENEDISAIMNKHFINIKVDREERPDLDKIYQTAHSLLTQRAGGWPLTIFLTPDEHMPFFAGTYFPDIAKHGLPSFTEILQHVADAYENNQDSIQQQNIAIRDVFTKIQTQSNSITEEISAKPIDIARSQLNQNFDQENGGYGSAPKFPHPTHLDFAMQLWAQSTTDKHEDFDILNTATFTLEQMSKGGLRDQIGGGFYRYSVDKQWQIPHFEKMLYDNGQLLTLYANAFTILQTPLFEEAAHSTASWAIREMQHDDGGFFSSIDADSEDSEGKFYIWTPAEVKTVISDTEYQYFAELYGLNNAANFEDKHWHFTQTKSLKDVADKYNIEIHELHHITDSAKNKLFIHREQRNKPSIDDKTLTSWNALMIKGMATAGRVFQNEQYIKSAEQAVDFIQRNLWSNNRLLASCKNGKAQLNAYLDDYAFLLDALLELLQAKWSAKYLQFACQLADDLLENFQDNENGGFYFTRHDHEDLILRQKNYPDEAMPSGNGIAAQALLKLGHLLADTRYLDAAENLLKTAFESISSYPVSHGSLLTALNLYLNQHLKTVIIRGDSNTAKQWQQNIESHYLPHVQHYFVDTDDNLPIALSTKTVEHGICAYICQGTQCSPPVYTLDDLITEL